MTRRHQLMSAKQWYSVREVAHMIGCTPQKIYSWIRMGQIPSAQKLHGTRWRISAVDAESIKSGKFDISGTYSKK